MCQAQGDLLRSELGSNISAREELRSTWGWDELGREIRQDNDLSL